jgi:tetratricopeptide (TPR) repeat protein
VSDLLIGLLSVLVATNQPAAVSNLVEQSTGVKVSIPDLSDPVEREYRKLMEDDDAALDEVDKWIQENKSFSAKGAGVPSAELNARIRARFLPMRKAYDDFLRRYPDHARAHVAYGSFLADINDEEGARTEWEKARELDPKNPATWNNLANHYGHDGPVKKAFEYYAKAIELAPHESTYYHNLGTTVYLFRKDAMEYYNIDEQAVFNKALELYQKAIKLDPTNFVLATDVASTYYGIKPTRTDDALNAYSNALKIATTEVEREGIYIHLARFELNADRFADSHAHLNMVSDPVYDELKARLTRNLTKREKEKETGIKEPDASTTNVPVTTLTNSAPAKEAVSPAPISVEKK